MIAERSLPDFADLEVQTVYQILCDIEAVPPEGEHWEGFVACRIVGALRDEIISSKPKLDYTCKFSADARIHTFLNDYLAYSLLQELREIRETTLGLSSGLDLQPTVIVPHAQPWGLSPRPIKRKGSYLTPEVLKELSK